MVPHNPAGGYSTLTRKVSDRSALQVYLLPVWNDSRLLTLLHIAVKLVTGRCGLHVVGADMQSP